MGLEDRDYYREHWRDRERERANEAELSSGKGRAIGRLFVLAICCLCVYLAAQVIKLRSELERADRVISQQVEQLKAQRDRPSSSP